MLANHTSMAQLCSRVVMQYNQLRKRNAFLEQYRKEPMFKDGFEEFDSSKYVLCEINVCLFVCLFVFKNDNITKTNYI